MTTHHRHQKHTTFILTLGVIVAVLATAFMLRQRTQFPHEAFPIRGHEIKYGQKKSQPKLPVTNEVQP